MLSVCDLLVTFHWRWVYIVGPQKTHSMRRFFWAPKTYVKTDGKENIYIFALKNSVYLYLWYIRPLAPLGSSTCLFQEWFTSDKNWLILLFFISDFLTCLEFTCLWSSACLSQQGAGEFIIWLPPIHIILHVHPWQWWWLLHLLQNSSTLCHNGKNMTSTLYTESQPQENTSLHIFLGLGFSGKSGYHGVNNILRVGTQWKELRC